MKWVDILADDDDIVANLDQKPVEFTITTFVPSTTLVPVPQEGHPLDE